MNRRSAVALSPKQEAFAHCLALGMSASGAYQSVYDSSQHAAGRYVAASRLASNAKVKLRVEAFTGPLAAFAPRTAAQARALVLLRLLRIMESARPSVQLRAAELIGRLPEVDLWGEWGGQAPDADLPDDEIRTRLVDRLRDLLIDKT